METIDGLAFIGRNPLDEDNVYIATGDSGMGMTHGTIAGMLLTDLILGRENPWATLYDPSRKTLRRGGRVRCRRTSTSRAQYADWITAGRRAARRTRSRRTAAPSCAAGWRKSRSTATSTGALHERSAVCPHLGCIVALEPRREDLGLPVPRLALRQIRQGDQRSGQLRIGEDLIVRSTLELFGLDLDAFALDVEAQAPEQAHVDVRNPHEREPAEDRAAPVGQQQAIARSQHHRRRPRSG